MKDQQIDTQLAREAKAIVALALRNGPIEDIHAGKICPTCAGREGYSHITDAQMRTIMKNAVNRVYSLLVAKKSSPDKYESDLTFGNLYTSEWDDPMVDGQ